MKWRCPLKTAAVKKLKPLDCLLYFIREREAVRLKKEAGKPAPWTDDEILQRYRFCNVRRMDDKVSRWLLDNWYTPYKDHPNMLAAAVLARHFNLPITLKAIQPYVFTEGKPDWGWMKTKVRSLSRPIFNAAYVVHGIGTVDKTEMVVDRVAKPLFESSKEARIVYTDSMEKTHSTLSCFWGMGSFMAGQVVADLRWAVSGTWADRNEWAPVGPGSARGLARLLFQDDWARNGRTLATQPKHWLRLFREHVLRTVRSRLPASIVDRLEAMDYQSCLCEFDKFERALWGQGTPKQRYPGDG